MSYGEVLTKAFKITIKNKFLWFFGIFVGSLGGLNAGRSYSGQDFSSLNGTDPTTFLQQYWVVILVVALVLFLIFLGFAFLSIVSQGALFGAVEKINKNKKTGFSDAFKIGIKNFWKILGAELLIGLVTFLITVLVFAPASFLIFSKLWVILIIYVLIFILLIMLLSIFVTLIVFMTYGEIVIGKKGIISSIKNSFCLFKKSFSKLLITYLILLLIGFGFGLLLVMVALLIGVPLVLFGFAIAASGIMPALVAYIAIFGTIFVVGLLILQGIFSSFTYSVWTLTYIDISKKK